MGKNYNYKAFTPDEVKQGLLTDLLNYLLDHNKKAKTYYYDIHIGTDGYCTIVEWCDACLSDDYDGGKFEFVDCDQLVMMQKQLPDNSYIYVLDDEEYQQELDMFLKEHPTYKQNRFGG